MSDKFDTTISRRSFLKTAAVAGVAATAGAGMLGAAPGFRARPVSAQDVSWTYEADVVVVGSGTGQAAALRAVTNGLSAIVLEKAAVGGGTTGISGGIFWAPNNSIMAAAGVPDSREAALQYLEYATFGQSTPELMAAYVDNCNTTIDLLRANGIDWELTPLANDYYPEKPGGVPEGRSLRPISTIEGASGGGALMRMLQQACEAVGVQLLFSHAAQRLIVNPDGSVAGVQADNEGTEVNVRALRGVIIASGGFDHNPEMVTHYLRGPIYYPSAVKTNTGDGHVMGMALGANLRNMNESWGWPVFFNEDSQIPLLAIARTVGRPGSIVVNRWGERFYNESAQYDGATRVFYNFDNADHEYRNIPAYAIFDGVYRSLYPIAGVAVDAEIPGWIKQADTLEELAALINVDPAGLAATVERFNEFAAQGLDPDFKRGVSAYDQFNGGDRTRTDIANPCLAPLTQGPFFAAAVWPGALGTCGGLQTNDKAQVLNVWGDVIPGLYATGNASASPMGAGYPAGGATVGAGMTFGLIAVDDMTNNRA